MLPSSINSRILWWGSPPSAAIRPNTEPFFACGIMGVIGCSPAYLNASSENSSGMLNTGWLHLISSHALAQQVDQLYSSSGMIGGEDMSILWQATDASGELMAPGYATV